MKRENLFFGIDKYRRFNFRDPRRLKIVSVDLSTPFVRIGRLPTIVYESDKEGRKRIYKHETKKPPVLYWNHKAKIGLIVGGSLKVDDWLYE